MENLFVSRDILMKEQESITIPMADWKRCKSAMVVVQMGSHDFKRGLFKSNRHFQHDGRLYLCTMMQTGRFNTNYIGSWLLIDECQYQGQCFDQPPSYSPSSDFSLTLIDGERRKRGDLQGMRVTVNGQPLVLGQFIHIKPLLPSSIFRVSESQAQNSLKKIRGTDNGAEATNSKCGAVILSSVLQGRRQAFVFGGDQEPYLFDSVMEASRAIQLLNQLNLARPDPNTWQQQALF